jgi:hypothetical protein
MGSMSLPKLIRSVADVLRDLAGEVPRVVRLSPHSRTALIAENLFLRRQLAFYWEREIRRAAIFERSSALVAVLVALF